VFGRVTDHDPAMHERVPERVYTLNQSNSVAQCHVFPDQAVIHALEPEVIDNVILLFVDAARKQIGATHNIVALQGVAMTDEDKAVYFDRQEKYEVEESPYEVNESAHSYMRVLLSVSVNIRDVPPCF
jgi:hypothetical protein